ncbi:hypothetical protein [Chryseobacterium sp.]|uniref:hypothetical protein n=1 Tax=Chryseobacterium sp. TaxID=1871047 RepID=UPI002FC60D71
MNNLQIAIDNLYEIFSKYNTIGIHHCDCGCIDTHDVKKLNSKPLRELEADDLISYHGSALYTWGDTEHYKHFLPRICELISEKGSFRFVTLDEFQIKLEYAEWKTWPDIEQQVIIDYIMADWIYFVNTCCSEVSDTELLAYIKFLDVKKVLQLWDIAKSDEALHNFVYFFYYYGTEILNDGLHIAGKRFRSEFLEKISEKEIIPKLEYSFFQNEQNNPDYADKISIVLQMIEQEMKIKRM